MTAMLLKFICRAEEISLAAAVLCGDGVLFILQYKLFMLVVLNRSQQ